MDTSGTYIRMCKAAEEIQDSCPFGEGDFIFNQSAIPNGYLFVNYKYQPCDDQTVWELIYNPEDHAAFNIWLPRQDQLQEMVDVSPYAVTLATLFHSWLHSQADIYDTDWSMEQLWLAYVMSQKYGKRWNGNEWVIRGI